MSAVPFPLKLGESREAGCVHCGVLFTQYLLTESFVHAASIDAKSNQRTPAIELLNRAKDGAYVHSTACVACTRLELARDLPMNGVTTAPAPAAVQHYVDTQRAIAQSRPARKYHTPNEEEYLYG